MNAPARTWVNNISWLGDLPEGWEATTVRRVTTFRDVRNDRHDDRLLSLSAYTGVRHKELDDENRARTGEDLANYWRVEPALLVVNPMWLNHGSVAVSNIRGVISPDYRVYELRDDLLPRFAHYVFRSSVYRSLYGVLTRGHTTYDRRISKDDFASLPFAVPPMAYQQAIADFLDEKTAAIDALIEKKERLMALVAEKRAVLIHQAVTKGLDPTVPMKPSGIPWIGDIPAHWEMHRVRRLLTRSLRNGLFKKRDEFGSGTRLVNVGDVFADGFLVQPTTLERVTTSHAEARSYEVQAGDIFFVRSSLKLEGVAASAVAPPSEEPMVFECHLVGARPDKKKVEPRWLSFYLNSTMVRHHMVAAAKTTTMTTIGQDELAAVPVSLPPPHEQREVATKLEALLQATTSLDDKIRGQVSRLREYRQGLITASVTGQFQIGED